MVKDKEQGQNILALRWGGLGDLLIVLPALRLIKHLLKRSRITLIARSSYGDLLKGALIVDEVISLEDSSVSYLFQNKPEIKGKWLEAFDLVVSWLNKPQVEWADRMKRSLSQKFVAIIADKREFPLTRHFFEATAKFLGKEAPSQRDYELLACLPVREEWQEEAEGFFPWFRGQPFVVIHPGSGGRAKRWPLTNFLDIVNYLARRRMSGAVLTGPAEEEYDSVLASFRWPGGWGWRREPTLRGIAWLLSKASFYMGNDSGITHLAGLCGCSGIALFREEESRLWAPSGKLRIVRAPRIEDIAINDIKEEIRQLLAGEKG